MQEEELKRAIDHSIKLMMEFDLIFLAKPGEIDKYKLALLALGDHICTALGYDGYEPYEKEPLIKDEKVRKAVRAWAEANGIKKVYITDLGELFSATPQRTIQFEGEPFLGWVSCEKTIAELCGEEKPRPVIVNGVKYSSYEDYLKSKGKK